MDPDTLREFQRFAEVVVLAGVAGWICDRLVDPGVRVRGIDLLAGLVGLFAGAWLWQVNGWPPGPAFGSEPVLPTMAGTLGVFTLIKLAALGAVGPRW